jgi:hypothetical protein
VTRGKRVRAIEVKSSRGSNEGESARAAQTPSPKPTVTRILSSWRALDPGPTPWQDTLTGGARGE